MKLALKIKLFVVLMVPLMSYLMGTLRKLIVSINTSTRVGQCATVFTIISLFSYPVNEAACPPVSTAYSPIMSSEVVYASMRVH